MRARPDLVGRGVGSSSLATGPGTDFDFLLVLRGGIVGSAGESGAKI